MQQGDDELIVSLEIIKTIETILHLSPLYEIKNKQFMGKGENQWKI